MKKNIIAVAIAVALTTSSCALLKSACDKSVPVLMQGQSMAFEAEQALQDAEKAINSSSLSDEAKATANSAMSRASAGLKSASKALAVASTACSQPDITQLFSVFVAAWSQIREFLALVGGSGTSPVDDPTVYRLDQ